MSKKEKEHKEFQFKDDRLKWILVANDDDVYDGIYTDTNERERFLAEVNPDDWNIMDYVDSLENTNANYISIVDKMQFDIDVLKEECDELLYNYQESREEYMFLEDKYDEMLAYAEYAEMYPVKHMFKTIYYRIKAFIKQ